MAEEFIGFHRPWDLGTRRSLPERVQERRKALRGKVWIDRRDLPVT